MHKICIPQCLKYALFLARKFIQFPINSRQKTWRILSYPMQVFIHYYFRHEKTKKKRGSYRGGPINVGVNSIKFDSD